ncbi:hypothetical protein B2J86_10580 [Acidovorax sp. SRB_14]|uniref:MmgE/PrpD family protein n=1 Tax=Acidovorax sp. SRB_14 TaxID=1962699 RepID=UPI001562EC60|nr:MmgE/PrpD family protein [Acidovorax sp. SRB_14]NMM81360.1 hypothetical protein [Acidovorax sp. SRB_14]
METTLEADRGLISFLGNFAANVRLEDAPAAVRRQAILSILDTVGCMVAGAQAPESRDFLMVETQRTQAPEASVIGHGPRVDVATAIRVNAYLGDVFELNDLTGGHASIAVVPTALAHAEALRCDGRALVEAVIAGIEVTSRVYAAYYPTMKSYEETGIAPPGIPSTIGATAAAARLHGMSAEATGRALAIAAALAGWCPAEVIFGQGGTIKPMLFGSWPGSVATMAVAYAQAGFSGPARVLESPIGLYPTLARSFDASQVLSPSAWHLEHPRRKRHACCGYIHSALDGVVAMRLDGVDFAAAEAIVVHMPAYIIPGVSKSGPPTAPNEARFHAEYCIALAAAGADSITPDHSIDYVTHMELVAPLMRRVRVVEDVSLAHYHQSVVSVRDAGGREVASRVTCAPKGAPLDPMTNNEVRAKFVALCGSRLAPGAMSSYLARMDGLEATASCEWIVRSFA